MSRSALEMSTLRTRESVSSIPGRGALTHRFLEGRLSYDFRLFHNKNFLPRWQGFQTIVLTRS